MFFCQVRTAFKILCCFAPTGALGVNRLLVCSSFPPSVPKLSRKGPGDLEIDFQREEEKEPCPVCCRGFLMIK